MMLQQGNTGGNVLATGEYNWVRPVRQRACAEVGRRVECRRKGLAPQRSAAKPAILQ